MPRLAQAALDFGDSDPLEVVLGLLATAGIDNPETLRGAFWLPAGALHLQTLHLRQATAGRNGTAGGGAGNGIAAVPVHTQLFRSATSGAADAREPHAASRIIQWQGVLRMNEQLFRAIVGELIDENPFACRALLKILAIEFTEQVATLAVTTGDEPRLLVNLGFLAAHCKTEAHVKAVICHEFLHVLLRHTDRVNPVKPVENLACDAVINAMIHRELGEEYSDFMKQFYAEEKGMYRLLRPWWAR